MRLTVGLVGDHNSDYIAHRAIPKAIELAAAALGIDVAHRWIDTKTIDPDRPDLGEYHGLWCVPGSPYRKMESAVAAIRFARERHVPFFGSCGGFQYALLECAASLWGVKGATHAELDSSALNPVIAPLACRLLEVPAMVHFAPGSRLANAYGCPSAEEEYHCSYGLNPICLPHLEAGPLRATAWDDSGDIRGVELDDHPFFVGTLFQGERAALRGVAPPAVSGFLAAVASGT